MKADSWSLTLILLCLAPAVVRGEVTLNISDSDAQLDAQSTIAGPGENFTILIDVGITGGEAVAGLSFLLQADQAGVLRITGRGILSTTLNDAITDSTMLLDPMSNLLGSPDGLSPLDIGAVSHTPQLLGIVANETLMSLTLTVEENAPIEAFPIHLTLAKARWAALGDTSTSVAINTETVVYAIYAVPPDCTPPTVISAESRRQHGSVGSFGVPLPLSNPVGVECREGGPQQIVVTYNKPIGGTPVVVLSAGTLDGLPIISGDTLTINILPSSIPDKTCVSVTINGVACADETGMAPETVLKFAYRKGDVDGNQGVSASDIVAIKASSSFQNVNVTNFRYDIDCSGKTQASDIVLVKGLSVFGSTACGY